MSEERSVVEKFTKWRVPYFKLRVNERYDGTAGRYSPPSLTGWGRNATTAVEPWYGAAIVAAYSCIGDVL